MKLLFNGPASKGRSLPLSALVRTNLVFEPAPQGSTEPGMFFLAPGYILYRSIGTGPIRGQLEAAGYGWVVSGSELYRVTPTASNLIGTVPGTSRVTLVANETQLVVMHSAGWHRCIMSTLNYEAITGAPTTAQGCYIDGYIAFPYENGTYGWTQIGDSTIDALDFASAESNPDPIIATYADHRRLILFGEKTTEWAIVSGDADAAFTRTSISEYGCAAKYSIAKTDSSVFWVGRNDQGSGRVYRAQEGSPTGISDFALEETLRTYGDLSDAYAYCFQMGGHTYYVLTFPDRGTWAYDIATQRWHQWTYTNPTTGAQEQHRSNGYMFVTDKHLVGDYVNGNVYELKADLYTNNGDAISWRWTGFPVENENKRIRHDRIELIAEMGVGLDGGKFGAIPSPGADPHAILSWSDDGGKTWEGFRLLPLGRIGEYMNRAYAHRLGASRRRIYGLEGADPVKTCLFGLNLKAEPLNR